MRRANFFQEYGVLLAFAVLIVINIATRGQSFLQPENLRNLLTQSAIVGMIAIGSTFVIISAGIDLSVGSLAALCGAIGILTLNKVGADATSTAIWACLGSSLLVGLAGGVFNGILVAYGRIAPFVVTLAGLAGYRSLALVLGRGGEIRSTVPTFDDAIGFAGVPIPGARLANGGPVVLYWSAVAFLAVALIAGFLLNRTRFGRYVVAVGANERAARYSAINTATVKIGAYAITGALCGLAAFFDIARYNSIGTGTMGKFYELDAIAAVVIGGTSLNGGKGRIWGTVVGIILMTLISNMMTAYRVDTNWQGLVSGLVILIAVLLQRGSKNND